MDAGPTVEEECQAQKAPYACREAYYDESTSSPLDLKLVDDAVKEELEFMR